MSLTKQCLIKVKFKRHFSKIRVGCGNFKGPFHKNDIVELPGDLFHFLLKKDVIENKIIPNFKLYGGCNNEKTK